MKNIIRKHWSEIEDELLRKMYFKENIDDMIKTFNRSWDAIKLRAGKLQLNRWSGFHRESDLSVLLNETPETMYWIGFLLADGYFSKKSRLVLTLAIKDELHLKIFAKYINSTNIRYGTSDGHKNVNISAQDIDIIPKFVERYQTSNNKTINPPNISLYKLSKDQFISMFIGFIDGDGCIQKRVYHSFMGRIKCHSSWLLNIQFMRNKLCGWTNNTTIQEPFINKQGYTEWYMTAGMLRELKIEGERLQLPILKRKWNVVIPAIERILNDDMTLYVCNSSKRTIDLAKELGINYTTIYQARIRHRCPTASILCFRNGINTIRGDYDEIKNIIGCSKSTISRRVAKLDHKPINGWIFTGYETL